MLLCLPEMSRLLWVQPFISCSSTDPLIRQVEPARAGKENLLNQARIREREQMPTDGPFNGSDSQCNIFCALERIVQEPAHNLAVQFTVTRLGAFLWLGLVGRPF